MDFDYIEGLTEEQVKEYYDTIIEKNDFLVRKGLVFEVKCSNGYVGYYAELGATQMIGAAGYGVEYYKTAYFGSIAGACGIGVYGYSLATKEISDSERGCIFQVKCSDGYVGYYAELGCNHSIGVQSYAVEYNKTANFGSIAGGCGIGRYGYTLVTGTF